jgi:4,5-dihydroxyphthalate decarboxylase
MSLATVTLRTALGRYPGTAALHDGSVSSPLVRLEFQDVKPPNRAFAPMVRELRYDLSEMAIATALQALAYRKPLVLLPITVAARFQEAALLCRRDGDISRPEDLRGRRVGVRSYSQTTAMWLRASLLHGHGVESASVRWITFEGAHVAEYRDPPWVERALDGSDMLAMLHEGALDAAVFGNDLPADDTLRPVFSDPAAAGEAFFAKNGFVPVNHMVVLKRELAEARPDLIPELLRLFAEAKRRAPLQGGRDVLPIGRAALGPAVEAALRDCAEQGLLPHPLTIDEVWAGLPVEQPAT